MKLKNVIFGFVCAVSSTGFAQSANWKQQFGECLNDSSKFSSTIKIYSEIASLKATAQLQNVESLPLGDDYYRYISAILSLKTVAEDLKTLNDLDKTGYFKSLFTDPRFQDFAASANFGILDLLKLDGDFLNPSINKDPRLPKLISNIKGMDEKAPLRAAWDRLFATFSSPEQSQIIRKALTDLGRFGDWYKINVSIINPEQAKELADYATWIQSNLRTTLSSQTALKDLPFPTGLSRVNNRYTNNFAELSSVMVTTRIKYGLLVPDLKSSDLEDFLQQNPKSAAALKSIIQARVKNFSGFVSDILNYLNSVKRPSGFAFDEFIVKKQWEKDGKQNVSYPIVLDTGATVQANQSEMAAIDGLARTLVGEAMSCQSAGSRQYEAIGLVFAERAKSIEDYYAMRKRTEENDQDPQFFEKQKAVFYSANVNEQFYRYLSNNLRGALDFGRKDTRGISLHPISQALSAPMQFDSWQAVRSQKVSLRTLKPQISKNIPEVNLDFYLPQTTQEANVFDTVLCPLKRAQNQHMFEEALDVAAQVVLNQENYRSRFQFVDAKGSAFKEVYFYTHGVPLGFAIRVPTVKLKDNQTKQLLPLVPPTTVGACGKVMFFKATPQNSYRM